MIITLENSRLHGTPPNQPGTDGLAQINGCRGETNNIDNMQKRVEIALSTSISGRLGWI